MARCLLPLHIPLPWRQSRRRCSLPLSSPASWPPAPPPVLTSPQRRPPPASPPTPAAPPPSHTAPLSPFESTSTTRSSPFHSCRCSPVAGATSPSGSGGIPFAIYPSLLPTAHPFPLSSNTRSQAVP
ncbi:hypothetical protein DAI22_05g213500 [Oryza sativa Japonica Group]|uniref:cDNA clone:J023122D13, full insert sequence n=2 Tax=Oryza sativa subsp. japonica TaxID=39947 RepID=Q6AVN6_ORYSJ|nr:unknown protein [Oryza sativa Japonica Group]KAF2931364.1 hypothetical protein DAI22_05g213500 [Oryza sativa Japonica Group]BAG94779.1 unnamed protein product [Oryza sativa Japonica Group]BAG95891.1 unnamed protein product [Oryza sativa Japonica Group]